MSKPAMHAKIFIDSDVIISALLSEKGAAHLLIHEISVEGWYSNFSYEELLIIIQRFPLSKKALDSTLSTLKRINLENTTASLQAHYRSHVTDTRDAHIVAGAKEANTQFLITYNVKHYQKNLLLSELNLLVLTPGSFLQYLRSQR